MEFSNKNNEDLSGYLIIDFFDSQGRYRGVDCHSVGIEGLEPSYIYRWDDGLSEEESSIEKHVACERAPAPLAGYCWKTDTDEDGVFLVMLEA